MHERKLHIEPQSLIYSISPLLGAEIKANPELNTVLPDMARMIFQTGEVTGLDVEKVFIRPYVFEPDGIHSEFWADGVIVDVALHKPEDLVAPFRTMLQDLFTEYEMELDTKEFDAYFEKVHIMIR